MSWPDFERLRAERNWFLDQVLALCIRHHGRVISWGRDAEGNAQVGGKPTSLHLWGNGALAVDVTFQQLEDKRQVMEGEARRLGLHWNDSEPTTLSLHLQARPAFLPPGGAFEDRPG